MLYIGLSMYSFREIAFSSDVDGGILLPFCSNFNLT
jgi:hypothetical protein